MINLKRISVPTWAPSHARHRIEVIGDLGSAAKAVITPLLPQIYEELDRRVNEFANDPNQCFRALEGFPDQSKLSGEFYIGSETFEGDSSADFYRLTINIRCSAKTVASIRMREGYDYLGLEAIIIVNKEGTLIEFDEGFNTSSI